MEVTFKLRQSRQREQNGQCSCVGKSMAGVRGMMGERSKLRSEELMRLACARSAVGKLRSLGQI